LVARLGIYTTVTLVFVSVLLRLQNDDQNNLQELQKTSLPTHANAYRSNKPEVVKLLALDNKRLK